MEFLKLVSKIMGDDSNKVMDEVLVYVKPGITLVVLWFYDKILLFVAPILGFNLSIFDGYLDMVQKILGICISILVGIMTIVKIKKLRKNG